MTDQATEVSAAVAAEDYLKSLLPEFMFKVQVWDLFLWQWVGLVLVVALAVAAAWTVLRILFPVLRRIVSKTSTAVDDQLVTLAEAPARLALATVLFSAGAGRLELQPASLALSRTAALGLLIVAAAWLAVRLVDLAVAMGRAKLEAEGRRSAVAALPLAGRAAKIALAVVAGIVLLQNMGMDVTGLIAGLGVGGLAVALAAQKSVANLFGGVSIVADQPVRVGDFCRFGDGTVGTVEEIGIRSTRIRTLDRTLVTVPNADFSELQVENFGMRDMIRFFTVLGLRYETSPDQMRHVLAAIRRLLLSHARVTDAPARARFVGFGAHSLDVEIFAYVTTSDFNEFVRIREDLLLKIMDIVAESGTGFAFPSQTLYMGRDGGLDQEAARKAEMEIAEKRKEGRLPFPDFTEEEKEGFRSSVPWPPEGSALGGSGA